MSESEHPGYRREWVADEDWKVGGGGRVCRMKGCYNDAVAMLKRRQINALEGFVWWPYCREHLYGRRIVDGVVMVGRLVPDATYASCVIFCQGYEMDCPLCGAHVGDGERHECSRKT